MSHRRKSFQTHQPLYFKKQLTIINQRMARQHKSTTITGELSLAQLQSIWRQHQPIQLDQACRQQVDQAARVVVDVVNARQAIYGINTGLGALVNTHIDPAKLTALQHNLLLSHAIGHGSLLDDQIVRLALLLKINMLLQGYSGVRWVVIEKLTELYNRQFYPCIPAQGSVGASGDLAPLAFMSLPLIGEGKVRHAGKIMMADQALAPHGISPLVLQAKEGLALVNGLQISTAILAHAYFKLENIIGNSLLAGCLSLIAVRGSLTPFDDRLYALRDHKGPRHCARLICRLIEKSGVRYTPVRVQDPYSIRCQAQVLGACLQLIDQVRQTLTIEINAVSDNPIVFARQREIVSGGNFHGELLAFAADQLAIAIAEAGSIAERRIALLVDARMSGLPAFLVADSGVNSGFMLGQVVAAALVSENKALAHPRSTDNIPTSANQEDHVSMATQAGYRLLAMLDNLAMIVALELAAAAQGLRFSQPEGLQGELGQLAAQLQQMLPDAKRDHLLQDHIERIKREVVFDNNLPQGYIPK
jgi:histidine ammonia-lyase